MELAWQGYTEHFPLTFHVNDFSVTKHKTNDYWPAEQSESAKQIQVNYMQKPLQKQELLKKLDAI